MFTNIFLLSLLYIDIIGEQWDSLKKYTNIRKNNCFEILHFCLVEGNYFDFCFMVYLQIFDMPIGNPVSTIIADITTQTLLNCIMAWLSNILKTIVKYVYDIFAIIPKESVDETLCLRKSFHQRLKFTYERGEKIISFVDIMVGRSFGNWLDSNWYRKAPHQMGI